MTGSPNAKAAGEWVVKRATEWGLKNAHLEPCDFGHDGWLDEQSAMAIAAAVYHLATRDEKLPRLTKEQMPPLPTTSTQ